MKLPIKFLIEAGWESLRAAFSRESVEMHMNIWSVIKHNVIDYGLSAAIFNLEEPNLTTVMHQLNDIYSIIKIENNKNIVRPTIQGIKLKTKEPNHPW